jgi:hypothetical protein
VSRPSASLFNEDVKADIGTITASMPAPGRAYNLTPRRKTMHEAIKALEKLQTEFDERLMDSIPPENFHILFARVLKEIIEFKRTLGTRTETAVLIDKAQRMLEVAGRYHLNNGVSAPQKTADRFRQNVDELFELLEKQLRIDEKFVAEAEKLELFRAALEACGIDDYVSRGLGRWAHKRTSDEKTTGLAYARNNIEQFAALVHDLGSDRDAVRNRLPSSDEVHWIALFQRVKLLTGELALIPA